MKNAGNALWLHPHAGSLEQRRQRLLVCTPPESFGNNMERWVRMLSA